MAIRCGKGHEHETVAEVRECYAVEQLLPSTMVLNPPATMVTVRSNKFGGNCVKCGHYVGEQEGRIERNASGKWDVFHLDGQCSEVPATPAPAVSFREDFKGIPAGHYATASLTGNDDYDFWRVDAPTEGKWAGRIFVKRVIGGKPEAPVRGATRHAALSAILFEGIEVCGMRYADELGACRNCNRHLTDELSRSRGYGPDCWGARA